MCSDFLDVVNDDVADIPDNIYRKKGNNLKKGRIRATQYLDWLYIDYYYLQTMNFAKILNDYFHKQKVDTVH